AADLPRQRGGAYALRLHLINSYKKFNNVKETLMKKTLYGLVAASMLAISPASHAAWPGERPIQMIVAYAPGGGTDIMARLVARFAEERLPGSRFVVVNKPGAGGAIGFEEIARSKPDGYTIGMINAPGFNFMPLYRNTN